MEQAGFVDVVEKHSYWPLDSWPRGRSEKQIGVWTQQNLLDGLNAMRMAALTRGLGWSTERVDVFFVEVKGNAGDRRINAY